MEDYSLAFTYVDLSCSVGSREAEVRQTVYAAWHDLIAYDKEPTDDQIVKFASTEEYGLKKKRRSLKEIITRLSIG